MTDLPTTSAPVTIFATTTCGYCHRLRAGLDSSGTPYGVVDVDENPEAGEWVKSVNGGNRVVPTVLYSDGTYQTNPPAVKVRDRYEELTS